jgi:branched-chain amino acid transport system substrate-binding protein
MKSTKLLRSILIAGAALAAVGLLPAGARAEGVKIGAFLAVTGGGSFLGDPEKKTLETYVEKINAAGGLLGKPVELIVYDSASDAKQALTFVKRLIEQDSVDLIIGGTSTGETMAVIAEVEQAGIPFISMAGAVESTSRAIRMRWRWPLDTASRSLPTRATAPATPT